MARRRRRRSVAQAFGAESRSALLAAGAGALFVLVAAVIASFGWLDLLRGLGALGLGPRLPDSLPLRRLAGESAQPLGRVVVVFACAGLVAGFALARLSRPARFGVLLVGALGLLALASQASYAVQETESLGRTLSTRHPGSGVLIEAVLLAAAGAVPTVRRRRPRVVTLQLTRSTSSA